MTEGMWAAPGVECQCIRDTAVEPWIADIGFGIGIIIDGPMFMRTYTIEGIEYRANFGPGHRVKLKFRDYPEGLYCICGFVPVQKIEDVKEDEVRMNHPKHETV